MIQPKTICPNCGREISNANFRKHYDACIDPNSKLNWKRNLPPIPYREADDLKCHFCGKLCKNLNSVKQHECRCSKNPDRKAFDHLTKYIETESKSYKDNRCLKSRTTLKKKYLDGFVSPNKGRKVSFEYYYADHNDSEIQKWLKYMQDHPIDIEYDGFKHVGSEGYISISNQNICKATFEHELIAGVYSGLFTDITYKTVHHIDRDRSNNDKMNLMIFDSSDDHKRYHNSPYAYLIYNEETHLFKCEIRKSEYN